MFFKSITKKCAQFRGKIPRFTTRERNVIRQLRRGDAQECRKEDLSNTQGLLDSACVSR